MAGKLIVIDGGDASGKHTQVKMLAKSLERLGHTVKTLDFPQYGSFFGKMVKDYLNGKFGAISEMDPKLTCLLYALDRFDQSRNIREWLEKGNIVVLDRYVESNLAYQSAKVKDKDMIVRWIQELEYKRLGIPKADLVIYLHVPLEFSSELMKGRPDKQYIEGGRKDLHEGDPGFLKMVEKQYLDLAKKFSWIKVDSVQDGSMLSREKIASILLEVVRIHLSP